jgi:hypothetical protein
VLIVLCAGTAGHATTFSVKAVKKNPTCVGGAHSGEFCAGDRDCDTTPTSFDGNCGGDIAPTSAVAASPGEVIVAEIYASDWTPTEGDDQARTWQVAVDSAGFFSGGGSVVPVGWDRPVECILCDPGADLPCPDPWECDEAGYCTGPAHDPDAGLAIDSLRADYIFVGRQEVTAIDTCQFLAGSTVLAPPGPTYSSPPKYVATLALEVAPGACGTFVISLLDKNIAGNWVTFIRPTDVAAEPILPLLLEDLTIDAGPCGCSEVLSSVPANCMHEARQPSEPDGSEPAGWNSVELEFECTDTSSVQPGDFTVTQVPLGDFDIPPAIDALVPNGSTLNVVFDRVITPAAWTCVRYDPSGQRVCIGWLPADVNGDGTSSAVDILAVIDNLNDQVDPPYEEHQCDVDRSGSCGPPDILRVIDLLNGADAYDPMLNASLPACPSGP